MMGILSLYARISSAPGDARHLTQQRFRTAIAVRALTVFMHYVIPSTARWLLLPPLGNQKAQHTTMTETTPSPAMPSTTGLVLRSLAVCAMACSVAFVVLYAGAVSAKSKPSRTPRPEPELKVIALKISPNPYTISAGSVEFSTVVQLPKELDGATILEVSSLVSSPSKRSIRFLSFRKPLESPKVTAISADPHTIPIVLTWDGMDQTKAPAEAGIYQFELRAKLLSNGEKGPRTLMVSWPKRGTLDVR